MMSFKFIGKALAAINATDMTGEKGNRASYLIGTWTQSRQSSLDNELDAGWLAISMRGVQVIPGQTREHLADLRRGAQLMQYLTGMANLTNDFAEENSKAIIRNVALPPIPNGSRYFKPSVWAFATRGERTYLEQAWEGAAAAVEWGIDVVLRAQAQAGPARDLYQRWFALNDAAAVRQKLVDIQNGMANRTVGICYQGLGVAANGNWATKLNEVAHRGPLQEVELSEDLGWSKAVHGTIGFGPEFFNHNAKLSLTLPHNLESRDLCATRFGAMVHELSHYMGNTRDVILSQAVYEHLHVPDPGEQRRKPGYGPLACHAMALVVPNDTRDNADNYRLFCEEVMYSKPTR